MKPSSFSLIEDSKRSTDTKRRLRRIAFTGYRLQVWSRQPTDSEFTVNSQCQILNLRSECLNECRISRLQQHCSQGLTHWDSDSVAGPLPANRFRLYRIERKELGCCYCCTSVQKNAVLRLCCLPNDAKWPDTKKEASWPNWCQTAAWLYPTKPKLIKP